MNPERKFQDNMDDGCSWQNMFVRRKVRPWERVSDEEDDDLEEVILEDSLG